MGSMSGHCVVCNKSEFLGGVMNCPICEAPHHKDCWEYNGGKCGIYGCNGWLELRAQPQVQTSLAWQNNMDLLAGTILTCTFCMFIAGRHILLDNIDLNSPIFRLLLWVIGFLLEFFLLGSIVCNLISMHRRYKNFQSSTNQNTRQISSGEFHKDGTPKIGRGW